MVAPIAMAVSFAWFRWTNDRFPLQYWGAACCSAHLTDRFTAAGQYANALPSARHCDDSRNPPRSRCQCTDASPCYSKALDVC